MLGLFFKFLFLEKNGRLEAKSTTRGPLPLGGFPQVLQGAHRNQLQQAENETWDVSGDWCFAFFGGAKNCLNFHFRCFFLSLERKSY